MGLLGDIYSASDSLKRKVKGLLSDPAGYLSQVGGGLLDDAKVISERNKRMVHSPETMTREDVSQSLASAMNFAPIGMTAWHGSPYKFDKFDISKIGTGEGAQAYGHGLYLAESPEVAKEYQRKLGGFDVDFSGIPKRVDAPELAKRFIEAADGDLPTAIARLQKNKVDDPELVKQAISIMRGATAKERGNLYKVDLPDSAIARMLDWDKPLSQQAPEVRNVFENVSNTNPDTKASLIDTLRQTFSGRKLGQDPSIGEVLKALETRKKLTGADKFGGAGVSEFFKQQGIPGIRYLDGGSRSAGQGSSNFVVFDPEMIRILERNGQATGLQPWKPGEYGLLNP